MDIDSIKQAIASKLQQTQQDSQNWQQAATNLHPLVQQPWQSMPSLQQMGDKISSYIPASIHDSNVVQSMRDFYNKMSKDGGINAR